MRTLVALLLTFAIASCSEKPPQLPRLGPDEVVLAFGDSITYGTGAGADEAYPNVLSKLVGRRVVGAGVPEPVLLGATAAFYGAIAKDYHLPFEAKILEELLFDRQFKSDPIHPNARGYRRLAEAMADLLRKAGAV